MACLMKNVFWVSGSTEINSKTKGVFGLCPSVGSLRLKEAKPKGFPILSTDFMGLSVLVSDQTGLGDWNARSPSNFSVHAQRSICVSRVMRWWEKTLKPNMIEIHSAEELVDSLLNAGDRLVIVDFYSPSCGGCRVLHPKICQLAESNPDAVFLKVNYEELKTMCYSLHIHVLPFFRFYRGAEGRLCSFSCTNATIKKFKDALVKHGTDRCSLGPPKGLDDSELLKLASNGEISIEIPSNFTKKERKEDLVIKSTDVAGSLGITGNEMEIREENAVFMF